LKKYHYGSYINDTVKFHMIKTRWCGKSSWHRAI